MNNSKFDEELLEFKMRIGRIWGELNPLRAQINRGLGNFSVQNCLILEAKVREFRLSLLVLFQDMQKALGESVSRAFSTPPGNAVEGAFEYFDMMQTANRGVNVCGEMAEAIRSHINEAEKAVADEALEALCQKVTGENDYILERDVDDEMLRSHINKAKKAADEGYTAEERKASYDALLQTLRRTAAGE